MFATRIIGLLCVLLTADCAGLQRAQPSDPPQINTAQGVTVTPDPMVAPAAPSITRSASQIVVSAESSAHNPPGYSAQPSEPLHPGAIQGRTVAVEPMVAKTPAKVLASPQLTKQVRKKKSIAQGPAQQETSPPLDLKSLETRLKETKAIGIFTKLALKNQVDDLLDQFRTFYQGRQKTNLAELRRLYDLLLLKVLALLQDTDPPLAGAIVASREAIWSILADPAKFATI
jgi:hypothetical protein